MAKKFYVREISDRKHNAAWTELIADSESQAAAIYVRKHNAGVRARYPKGDVYSQQYIITKHDVSVRSSRPTLGNVMSMETGNDIYVPRKTAPAIKRKLTKTNMAKKQFDALCKEADKIQMPVAYTNDLFKHDRAYLTEAKPERFIWIVRPWGTHLIPLDVGGLPLSKRQFENAKAELEYHQKEAMGGAIRKVYVMDKTKLRSTDFMGALMYLNGTPHERV